MWQLKVVLSAWQCPKLQQEVRFRIETLSDQTTRGVLSRKFTCEQAYMCRKEGPSHGDYSECVHPDSPSLRRTEERDTQ